MIIVITAMPRSQSMTGTRLGRLGRTWPSLVPPGSALAGGAAAAEAADREGGAVDDKGSGGD
jgi:hypothetical protein